MAHSISITIKNDVAELGRLCQEVDKFCAIENLPDETVYTVNLVLEEMITNTIKYGYSDTAEHQIEVKLSWENDELTIAISDDANEFNPLNLPAVDTTKTIDERGIGGLGIHLVRKLMDHLEYRRENGRNLFLARKRI